MLERAKALQEQMTAWRRDIHMHPELSFQEHRTAQVVAEALQEMGIHVETGVGITGVVGHIGEGSPVVGIRADMDALALQETNEVPYASQVPGVMHACGHDAHVAILLGVARLLSEMEDRPPGEVRLLFQPSEESQDEEGESGATRMIADGAMDGVDAVIALHVYSDVESGKIQLQAGYDTAAVDSFEATVIGTGGHGAYPHKGVDPIYLMAQVINAVNGIRARQINPTRAAVISFGAVNAGDTTNVIPEVVEMKGTIRSYDEETRHTLWERLEAAYGITKALGGDYTLSILKGYPALYNDPEIVGILRAAATDLIGKEAILDSEPGMGGEDFSYMAKLAPGAMFMLGAKLDDVARAHHTPVFDINEGSFPVGAAVLAEAACRLLKQPVEK